MTIPSLEFTPCRGLRMRKLAVGTDSDILDHLMLSLARRSALQPAKIRGLRFSIIYVADFESLRWAVTFSR